MEAKDIKALLIRSIVEELSESESAQLEAALAESEALRRERSELLRTRNLLRHARPPADPGFADRVMQKLEEHQSATALIVRLFPRVAAACAIVLVALSLFFYFEAGSLSADILVGLEDLSIEEAVALTEY